MLENCSLYAEERGLTFAQLYVEVNNLLGELAHRHEIPRFLLDWVSHRVTLQVEKDQRDSSHWTSEMRPEVGRGVKVPKGKRHSGIRLGWDQ